MTDYKLVPNLQQIVTDALVGMVSGVTQMVPPADEPLPDFIQAPIDRAVTRIRSEIDLHAAAAPAPVERNQCDGCQAGIPVENGMHRMGKPDGYPDLMLCTADRYSTPQPAAPDVAGLVHQHHRDSAELRRLCQARDEQRDGRLAALERAAKAEAYVAQLVEALEEIVKQYPNPNISHENFRVHACRHAEAALSAYRKGGEA